MGQTSGPDLLLVVYNALDAEEREAAFQRLADARLIQLADEQTEFGRHLRSLQLVTEHLGEKPNSTTYRRAWRELKDAGVEGLESLGSLTRFFGSWARACECLDLAEVNTADRIRARMANRRLGRVHQYSQATLRHWIAEAVADLGLDGDEHGRDRRAPQCREFLDWRKQRRALAEAQGEIVHIPTSAPYRRLTTEGTWPAAMRALGFTPEEVAARLDIDGEEAGA